MHFSSGGVGSDGTAEGPLFECKEAYGSKELDGQLVYFDVADPSADYWQKKLCGVELQDQCLANR